MRLVAIGVLLALVASPALPAQDRVVNPGGASFTANTGKRCERNEIEMIDARPADSAVTVPRSYLDHVNAELFFYFAPPEARVARYAHARVTVLRDGAIAAITIEESSHNDYFDREVRRAIGAAATARALALPPELHADSIGLDIWVGRHAGRPGEYRARRTVCAAWPSSRNPSPVYPVDLQSQGVRGFVRARFMVDTTGLIEPQTFQVIESSADAFTDAVKVVLPRLRYQPAEVQGRKIAQLTEQLFTFGFNDRQVH